MSEFAKGIIVKAKTTQYGEIIKLGIKKDEFLTNPFDSRGWLNIDILTSKEGKKYPKINDYKRTGATASEEVEEDITEEEIPF